jgi:hypothetical protein
MPDAERPFKKSKSRPEHVKQGHPASRQGARPETELDKRPLPVAGLGGGDFTRAAFERQAALLGDPRLSHPVHARQRALIVHQLQRDYGNRHVQRLVKYVSQKHTEGVQMRMKVGPAGDRFEQEADQVAHQVMSMTQSSGSASDPQIRLTDGGTAKKKPIQTLEEKEPIQMKSLQRQVGAEGGDVQPDLESAINRARGGGQALPENVRNSMEQAFGADFSQVRVHTGAKSDALNESLSARAFTTGQDVFVRQSDYTPGSRDGQELLAHELTHVVQQNGSVLRQSFFEQSNTADAQTERELQLRGEHQQLMPGNKKVANQTSKN